MAGRFATEQAALERRIDRVRADVAAQLAAAGVDKSEFARQAAQRLDALKSDQTSRLQENQAREKSLLDRQQNAAPAPGGATDRTADQAMDEIQDLERRRNDLVSAMAEEAAKLRDAITQELQQRVGGAELYAQAQPATANVDRSTVINAALAQDAGNTRDADDETSRAAAAKLEKRLDVADDRIQKVISAIEGARQDVERERATASDANERIARDRDLAALDARLETYRERAAMLDGVSKLLDQNRADLASRFLDAVEMFDGKPRAPRTENAKKEDEQIVDKLRAMEDSREKIRRSQEYSVLDQKISQLPPIKELWERATADVKDRKPTLKDRDLYDEVRAAFTRLLTREKHETAELTETARQARALFEKDGLRFERDERDKLKAALPMLDDSYVRSRLDMQRHADVLRVSGQHLRKLEEGGDPVRPDNIAFQFARDNMHMDASTGPLSEHVRKKVAEELLKSRAAASVEDVDASQ